MFKKGDRVLVKHSEDILHATSFWDEIEGHIGTVDTVDPDNTSWIVFDKPIKYRKWCILNQFLFKQDIGTSAGNTGIQLTLSPIFQVGDKAKVIRKAVDYENGWKNAWASEMDNAVGRVGGY